MSSPLSSDGCLGGCDSEGGQSDVSVGEGSTAFGTDSLSLNLQAPFSNVIECVSWIPLFTFVAVGRVLFGSALPRVLFPSLSRVFARGCQFRWLSQESGRERKRQPLGVDLGAIVALVVVGRYALSVSRCPSTSRSRAFQCPVIVGLAPGVDSGFRGLFSESVGHHRTCCSVVSRRPSAWVVLRCPSLGSL